MLQEEVFDFLVDLRSEETLNELFSRLGYTFVRRNEGDRYFSTSNWTDSARESLAEAPSKLFRAGAGNEFGVAYCQLRGSRLLVGQERRIISQLQSKNNFSRGLFIFSNNDRDRWHFVNVRQEADEERRSLQRRITVGPEERHRTASERIVKLKLDASDTRLSALEIQNRHNEAFDVEQVTKKFFGDYTAVYFALQDDLTEQTGDRRWAHDYSLQLVNRMMFLYFIQRKRWLGDDPEFMQGLWHAYRLSGRPEDSFFKDWLKVLFFESFNGRFHGGHRHFPAEIQEVLATAPYLNGGLFTENDLDQQYSFEISDSRFKTILDLLEHYNFTISEDSPLDQEVAVDPEMIGKVYESLVNVEETAADERSAAGIFYTPRTEIDLMCRLSLVDHLANHLGEDRKNLLYEVVFAIEPDYKDGADQQVADEGLWAELDSRLQEITVVDPACGSGSFLVGMLQVLDDLQERAARQLGREEESYDRRKRIIGQSLYGVDVMDWAVRVAELRLWLSLIIETELSRDELHVREEPLLPHFTFKLRPGDGLVQEVGGINLGHMRSDLATSPTLKGKITTLKNEKLKFYNNDPDRKFRAADQLRQEERNLFLEILDARRREIQNKVADLNHRIANPTEELQLEGMASPASSQLDLNTATLEAEVRDLQEDLDRTTRAQQAIRPDTPVPFVWDIAFVEVFEGEDRGFDIVVGNPPYVDQTKIADPRLAPEEITTTNKKEYKAKLARSVYQTFPDFFRYNFVEDEPARKLNGNTDLYVYFYFLGLSLLNRKGSFCFITSSSWLDAGYGKDLQEFLLKNCHVKMVLDNTKRSFASAAVNTVITLFSTPQETRDAAFRKTARFVMFTVPFEHVLDPVIFEELEEYENRATTLEYRIRPVNQQTLFENGAEVLAAEGNGSVLDSPSTSINPDNYIGNKWGGKYLRAPDIYWRVLAKAADKLFRLDEISDNSLQRGTTTGANEFFYLNDDQVYEWGIEEEFLKSVIKSPKECKRTRIDGSNLKMKLFVCDATKRELKGTAALEYLKWGESQNLHKRPTLRGRRQWWTVPLISGNSVYVKEGHDTWTAFHNPDNHPVDCRLYCANLPISTLLYLNSPMGGLLFEIYNRAGLGEGARSLMVADYAQIPSLMLPDRALNGAKELLDSVSSLPPRELSEPQNDEWSELDRFVFDALNLTQNERDAVYEGVVDIVEERLKRAASLI